MYTNENDNFPVKKLKNFKTYLSSASLLKSKPSNSPSCSYFASNTKEEKKLANPYSTRNQIQKHHTDLPGASINEIPSLPNRNNLTISTGKELFELNKTNQQMKSQTNYKSHYQLNSNTLKKTGRTNSHNKKIPESNSFSALSQLNYSCKSTPFSKVFFAKYRNYEEAKFSDKSNGKIIAYGANTNQGLFRTYNEDRVSIILNVIQPNSRMDEVWPKVSYFAVYDGHGGNKCADFLKENLHQYIFREKCFPRDPLSAIYRGFEEAERKFINNSQPANLLDDYERSGSCALVVIIMDDVCYVANLGDSRGLYSEGESEMVYQLSKDHKPSDPEEKERILKAGGKVYQGQVQVQASPGTVGCINTLGPWRIFPGRLSVSRSFGDLEAKAKQLGGNPKVLLATPSVTSFKIKQSSDFIVLGSDGLYDRLCNREIIQAIWSTRQRDIIASNIHQQSGKIVDIVMKLSLSKGTLDNITCIFICFENFYKSLFQKQILNGNDIIPPHVLKANDNNWCTILNEENIVHPHIEQGISQHDNAIQFFDNDKDQDNESSLRNIYSLTNYKKNGNYISLNMLSGTGSNLKPSPKLGSYENYKKRYEDLKELSPSCSTKNERSLPTIGINTSLFGKGAHNSFLINYATPTSKGMLRQGEYYNQNCKHFK